MMNRRRLVVSSATAAALVPGLVSANQASPEATPHADTLVDSGYLQIGELEMYYEVHGQGDPLVLLHGGFGSITNMFGFGELLPLFAQTRTVIGLEQQGHGHTADIDRPMTYTQMAEDTAAALGALGFEATDVFGYSDGGIVALGLAIAHPQLVRKVAIAGAYWNVSGVYPEVIESLKSFKPSDFPDEFRQMWAADAPNPEDFETVFAKVMALGVDFPGYDSADLAAISSPLLTIIADSDIVKPEHAVELFRLVGGGVSGDNVGLPASQLSVLPGTTHTGIILRTDALFSQISEFLGAPAA
jgi:pimeloyl-ACP methyl ester carboxylesterase